MTNVTVKLPSGAVPPVLPDDASPTVTTTGMVINVGPAGPAGATGPAGTNGATGATGPTGPSGGGGGGAVDSVNGHTGVVVLAASDVGADVSGAAATAQAAAIAASQPVDTDLTAIAALSTTTFGRSLLTLADAAAGRTSLGLGTAATQATSAFDAAGAAAAAQAASQPLDSDLTAIAALTTTSYGRAFLALADAAAARTALALGTAAQNATGDFDAAGAAASAQSASQPLDADLTAIAAITTASFGRGLLALASAGALRTSAGVVIGTDVQAFDAELAAIAGLTSAADTLPYFTGSGTAALTSFTTAGRALVDDADAAAQRTTLGLGTAATHPATDFDLIGANISGFCGDGSDGNVTISTTVTLTRDMFYDTLTVNSPGILITGGFRVYCKTACVVNTSGVINRDGLAATSATGAAVGAAGTVTGGTAGGTGGSAGVGGNGTNASGGLGSAGGVGGAGGTTAGGTAGTPGNPAASNGRPWALPMSALGLMIGPATFTSYPGGSGGGGGGGDGTNSGGGGGAGGGVLVLNARTVTNNGTISVNGGNGFSPVTGNTGGGGGGGGGVVHINTTSFTGTTPTAAGGIGGTKNGTGVNGSNGSAGLVKVNVWV